MDAANDIVLSVMSAKMIIKARLGRLVIPEPADLFVTERLRSQHLSTLAIELTHVLRSPSLPDIHHDPFDRLLVQSIEERLPILTANEAIARYDVDVVW